MRRLFDEKGYYTAEALDIIKETSKVVEQILVKYNDVDRRDLELIVYGATNEACIKRSLDFKP